MNKKTFMKVAKACIKECMKPIAFDANVSKAMVDASPSMKKRLQRYLELKEALEYKDE